MKNLLRLNKLYILSLYVFSLLLFSSCEEVSAEKSSSVINGIVTNVNMYGNLELSITSKDMAAAGYEYGDIVHVEGNGVIEEMDLPYVNNYICVGSWGISLNKFDDVECLTLSLSNASFYERIGGVVGGKIRLSMAKKGGFLDVYNELTLESTSVRDDYASDEVFANFRMVNCGNILPGKLYRSSKPTLAKGNPVRYQYADNLARKAGVNSIITFADTQEKWNNAVESKAGIGDYSMELYNKGTLLLNGMGADFYQEKNLKGLNNAMKFMLENEPPYLVCCDFGRDRTGMFSMLLEILADAKYEDIKSDYLETYENFYHINKNDNIYNRLKTIMFDKLLYIILNQGDVDIVQLNKMEDFDVNSFFPSLKQAVRTYFIQKVGISESELDAVMYKLQN